MKNEPMWRERFRRIMSGKESQYPYLEDFIEQELTSLGQAMVDSLKEKIERCSDCASSYDCGCYEKNSIRNEIISETRANLTAELSKRGIILPK